MDNNNNDSNSESDEAIETLMIDIESLPESPTQDQAELFLTSIGNTVI